MLLTTKFAIYITSFTNELNFFPLSFFIKIQEYSKPN